MSKPMTRARLAWYDRRDSKPLIMQTHHDGRLFWVYYPSYGLPNSFELSRQAAKFVDRLNKLHRLPKN